MDSNWTEIINGIIPVLPWIIMGLIQWRMINALDQALRRISMPGQQMPPAPIPPVFIPEPLPTPVPLPSPTPAPIPTPPPATHSEFSSAPPWFQWAYMEVGFHETGNNLGISRYVELAHAGSEGDPWCAIFTNAALETSGIIGSRSASSQSFRTDHNFIQLSGPALGCIVVYWRGSQSSGLGHVGFYRGENATSIWTLGGNENDMVQIEALPKSSASFGLIGYFWPKAVPLPPIKPVIMASGSPIHVQTHVDSMSAPIVPKPVSASANDVHSNIVATYFGGMKSAYGGNIDDNSPGVALPFHFTGPRPRVRVTGKKNGVSIDCDIVDVGPWNTKDPYWQTGTRPEAESGVDKFGRKTNSAGIDLTLAAAKATGIDGKGLVDWQFINTSTVNVT